MAEALVEELERNPGLRQRLARAIAPDVVAGIALSPELRGALIQALVREVATKGDVERLRESLEALRREVATKAELGELRRELEETRREMATREELSELRREMATKEELKQLHSELEQLRGEITALSQRVTALEARVEELSARIGSLEKWFIVTVVGIWSFLVIFLLKAILPGLFGP